MSEIEKLYSLAGVEPLGNIDLREMKILVDSKVFIEGKDLPNNYYNIYPPFTAEKQLALIKWLAQRMDFGLNYYRYSHLWVCQTQFSYEEYYHKAYENKDFGEALAGLINDLWQDLTETEKAEIKEILSE